MEGSERQCCLQLSGTLLQGLAEAHAPIRGRWQVGTHHCTVPFHILLLLLLLHDCHRLVLQKERRTE